MVTEPQQSGRTNTAPAAVSTPAVRCIAVAKRFGATVAVRDASFEVPHGALMALLGPSGIGKTTVLRLIAGFETPDAGSIEIDGRPMANGRAPVPPEQRRVGMVFQDYALFPHMTVRDNVAFGVGGGARVQGRVDDVLRLVGLTPESERIPSELSGGQQQRVALARALAPNPAVVLLDEPFSNLDAALRVKVRSEVRHILREAGTAAASKRAPAVSSIESPRWMTDPEQAVSNAARPAARRAPHLLFARRHDDLPVAGLL